MKIPSDFRYSANVVEIYSLPPSVQFRFPCLPYALSLRAFHSLNFSKASDLYFNMYSSICLVVSSMKGSIYRTPAMAVSRGPHKSKCTSCRGSVAQDVVFGVKGFLLNLHLMQHSQSHLPVILAAWVIVAKISTALRPTCPRRRCHNIRFYASCRDACPVVISASRKLSLISVYLVDSGPRSTGNS